MKKLDVLVVGDINVDFIMQGIGKMPDLGEEEFADDMHLCVGGSGANTVIALSKLDVNCGIYGIVSTDSMGDYIIKFLKKSGVFTGYIERRDDLKSGVSVAVTHGEDRCFLSYMGTNALFNPNHLNENILKHTKHVHISGFNWDKNLDNYHHAILKAKKNDCTVSLDIGWTDFDKYRKEILTVLQDVDIFFPNYIEANALIGTNDIYMALEELSKKVKIVIITLGKNGALMKIDGRVIKFKGFKVDALDAVGAGDSFDAGFLYGFTNNIPFKECLKIGCACGAITACDYGGSIASPTLKKLREFLKAEVE